MSSTATPTSASTGPRLRRTLTLWDLILYGVIVIQPVAPMSVFGVLSDRGHAWELEPEGTWIRRSTPDNRPASDTHDLLMARFLRTAKIR